MPHRHAITRLLSWTAVALLLPFVASADAVKALNGRVTVGYRHENTAGATVVDGGSTTSRAEVSDGAWAIGGIVTSPLYFRWLGGRLGVEGGGRSLESQNQLGIPGSTADTGRVDLRTELFLRSPELGHLDIGYRFAWESFSGLAVEQTTLNGVTLDAGFYIPDNGAGELDWDFFFSYGHERERAGTQEDAIHDYTAGAVIGWYLKPTLRLSGGFEWKRRDPELTFTQQDLLGKGELAWLLPIGERRNLTLSVFGGGGNRKSDLASPGSSIDQGVYSVGAGLSFSYPGAATLVELVREYH